MSWRGRSDLRALEGGALERAVGGEPVGQLFEVDLVGVELGPVDAGEAHPSADGHPAPAAHPGPVDHDRVERHDRADAEGPRQFGHRLHHGHRSGGVDERGAVAEHVGQSVGHQPAAALAAVLGAHHDPALLRQLCCQQHPVA
jgi:hypothetical protein